MLASAGSACPPLSSIHHLGLFTPPSNIRPSPNQRHYFSLPPASPSSLPPSPASPPSLHLQHFCSFSSWKLCCGQLLLRFSLRSGTSSLSSRTHAPLPSPSPPHHHFHPDTASLPPPFFSSSLSLSHFHCLYLSFQRLTLFLPLFFRLCLPLS